MGVFIVPVNFAVLSASPNFLGVPFYVLALFKGGFPEIVSGCMVSLQILWSARTNANTAITAGLSNQQQFMHSRRGMKKMSSEQARDVEAVMRLMDSAALLVHHTSGTLLYACCLTHVADKFALGVAAFAVGAQHAVSFLKYMLQLQGVRGHSAVARVVVSV